MSNISGSLEQQADLLFNNVAGWERNALRRIGRRVKDIKSLSYADLQAINNAAIVKQDINAILKELATLTGQSSIEVKRIYAEMIGKQHEENKVLYDYRGKPFVPLADNKPLQAIVNAYARTTAGTMVNLSMTKAKRLGFVDKNNNFVPLEKNFKQVLDKAVMSITTGTGDVNSEMRGVLKELGGSGLRVDYGGGVTRRLETMVRQNLLWGAKQASVTYNEMIGEELGCDGIEIDWHSNPRPSHEFMQGKQYVLGKARIINGKYFESADDALSALSDYGCLHFKTPIICGVSEPRFSDEELARLNSENTRQIEIDGVSKTGYEWKQTMRKLESEARKTKDQIELLKASGDNEGVRQLKSKLTAIEDKYNLVAKGSGIKAQPQRMSITKAQRSITSLTTNNNDIDFMSTSFRPLFSDKTDVTINNVNIELKGVSNSQFELYADSDATKRSKALRITEKNMHDITSMLPGDFSLPKISVIDFEKYGLNINAIGGYDKASGFLVINSRYDTNKKILEYIGKKEGYFANQTQYAPYLHELGHKYYEDSIKKLAKSQNISYNKSKTVIDDRIADYIHVNNADGTFVLKSISGHADAYYGIGKYTEVVAECFSVIQENPIAQEIINLLRM